MKKTAINTFKKYLAVLLTIAVIATLAPAVLASETAEPDQLFVLEEEQLIETEETVDDGIEIATEIEPVNDDEESADSEEPLPLPAVEEEAETEAIEETAIVKEETLVQEEPAVISDEETSVEETATEEEITEVVEEITVSEELEVEEAVSEEPSVEESAEIMLLEEIEEIEEPEQDTVEEDIEDEELFLFQLYSEIASEYDGLSSTIKNNCVEFVKYKANPPSGYAIGTLEQKKALINSYIPVVGSIAITDGLGHAGSFGHVAYVEAVNGNIVTTLNGGFSVTVSNGQSGANHIVRMVGTEVDQGILGYWVFNGPISTPTISNAQVTGLSTQGFTVSCKVDSAEVASVRFAVWTPNTSANGTNQDDLEWIEGVKGPDGTTWSATIYTSNHNNEIGCVYWTDIYAYSTTGGTAQYSKTYNGYVVANVPSATVNATLDVNGLLDGTSAGSTAGYGTFDVYINGSKVADDVGDYCVAHPVGTTYSISDIKAFSGKAYRGVYEGSTSGTIGSSNTYVRLKFSTAYTIAYNANGGTGAPSSQVKYYGENISLSTSKPTRAGYAFLGWATSSSATTSQYSSGSTYSNNAGVTLYAVWKEEYSFQVFGYYNGKSYNYNNFITEYGTYDVYINGTKVADDVDYYYNKFPKGTTYEISDIKAKSGYSYRGVAYGSLSGTIDSDLMPTLNFASVYTITYNANGGTGAPATQMKYGGEWIYPSTDIPTRAGYRFIGWAKTSSATNPLYYRANLLGHYYTYDDDASITLYAVWRDKAGLYVRGYLDLVENTNIAGFGTFDVYINGVKVADDVDNYAEQWPIGTTYEIRDVKVLDGKELSSITSLDGDTNIIGNGDNSYGSITVRLAIHTVYTITYNANGGTNAPATQVKYKRVDASLTTSKPTRSGYSFLGWATSPSATASEYASGSIYRNDANITLYAVWEKNPECSHSYQVSWKWDGYTSATATITCKNCSEVWTRTATITNKVTKAATCTAAGTRTYTAKVTLDGQTFTTTKTASIAAKGHTAVTDKAVAATCTKDGKTAGSHCSVCGEVIKAQTVVKATGHSYTNGVCTKCDHIQNGFAKVDGVWGLYKSQKLQTGTTGPVSGTISGKTATYFVKAGVLATGWQKANGVWYYMNTAGIVQTGWQKVSGTWYYMDSAGVMLTGWQKVGGKWYYLGTNGKMTTGWQQVDGTWYYMNSSGAMLTGWQKVSGKWYYLGTNGKMTTGWQKVSGKWYYMNSSGVMLTGWQKISGKWYYLGTDGVMVTGTQVIDGKTYTFNSSGVWVE